MVSSSSVTARGASSCSSPSRARCATGCTRCATSTRTPMTTSSSSPLSVPCSACTLMTDRRPSRRCSTPSSRRATPPPDSSATRPRWRRPQSEREPPRGGRRAWGERGVRRGRAHALSPPPQCEGTGRWGGKGVPKKKEEKERHTSSALSPKL
eukprot:scaffold7040_cov66-Phaeocystis_antarctica.AAC.2